MIQRPPRSTRTNTRFPYSTLLRSHMMSGMGRVFRYENSPPNPEIPDPDKADKMLKMDDRMFHLMAENDFATNGNDGSLMYANTRWAFQGEWRLGYNAHPGYEVETHFGRYLGKMQWLLL